MALYVTEAVVLRVRHFGEADKVLTLLSPTEGKLQAIAKGARRPRNRLSGVSEHPIKAHFSLFPGRSMDTVSQADVLEAFGPLRETLEGSAYSNYLAELVDVFLKPKDPHPLVYSLLLSGLHLLMAGAPADTVRHAFELQLLTHLGYQPALDHCAHCGHEPNGSVRWDAQAGGLACEACAGQGALSLRATTPDVLRMLMSSEPGELYRLYIDRPTEREVAEALRLHIRHRIDQPIKSLEFLEIVKARPA